MDPPAPSIITRYETYHRSNKVIELGFSVVSIYHVYIIVELRKTFGSGSESQQ